MPDTPKPSLDEMIDAVEAIAKRCAAFRERHPCRADADLVPDIADREAAVWAAALDTLREHERVVAERDVFAQQVEDLLLGMSDEQVIANAVRAHGSAKKAVEATHKTRVMILQKIADVYKAERDAARAELADLAKRYYTVVSELADKCRELAEAQAKIEQLKPKRLHRHEDFSRNGY